MSKNLYFQFDEEVATKAENILDDIGLDCQTFFKMCLKKLIKEHNISFLTMNVDFVATNDINENIMNEQQNMENENMISTGKNKITSTMRDCIWEIFKTQYSANEKINYPISEQLAISKSGINPGSAHIYFSFLNNLMKGFSNTRIVKYPDLEIYLSYINEQFPKKYIKNALQSLSDSIPYWKTKPTLYSYAIKVSILIKQYK